MKLISLFSCVERRLLLSSLFFFSHRCSLPGLSHLSLMLYFFFAFSFTAAAANKNISHVSSSCKSSLPPRLFFFLIVFICDIVCSSHCATEREETSSEGKERIYDPLGWLARESRLCRRAWNCKILLAIGLKHRSSWLSRAFHSLPASHQSTTKYRHNIDPINRDMTNIISVDVEVSLWDLADGRPTTTGRGENQFFDVSFALPYSFFSSMHLRLESLTRDKKPQKLRNM